MIRLFASLLFTTMFFLQVQSNETVTLNNTWWETEMISGTKLLLKLKFDRKNTFTLTSRKNSAQTIVGNQYFLGRLTGKVNKYAIEIEGKYKIKNDTIFLDGTYHSLTSEQEFSGFIVDKHISAAMTRNAMKGKNVLLPFPLRDYKTIVANALDSTERFLYNPQLLQTTEWKDFAKEVTKYAAVVADDYEFINMFNSRVGSLPFSHFGLAQNSLPTNTEDQNQETGDSSPPKFLLERKDSLTTLFTLSTFIATAEEIKPFLDTIKKWKPENLIIDLRDNGGGTIASALPLARYLSNDTLIGGAFLTQKYFTEHQRIPEPDEYTTLFEPFSAASFELILEGIHKNKGLYLVIYPDEETFDGNVYILTNNKTASTCEPLVYGLKTNKRATIVGEKTAGAMLNGERFDVHPFYQLWVPTADYYAADGFRIDKTGVEPNIQVESEMALERTLQLIKGEIIP